MCLCHSVSNIVSQLVEAYHRLRSPNGPCTVPAICSSQFAPNVDKITTIIIIISVENWKKTKTSYHTTLDSGWELIFYDQRRIIKGDRFLVQQLSCLAGPFSSLEPPTMAIWWPTNLSLSLGWAYGMVKVDFETCFASDIEIWEPQNVMQPRISNLRVCKVRLLHRPRGWNPLGRDLDKIVPRSTKHTWQSTKCQAPSTNQAQAQSNKHRHQAKLRLWVQLWNLN